MEILFLPMVSGQNKADNKKRGVSAKISIPPVALRRGLKIKNEGHTDLSFGKQAIQFFTGGSRFRRPCPIRHPTWRSKTSVACNLFFDDKIPIQGWKQPQLPASA